MLIFFVLYTFCRNCIHYDSHQCNLFKKHPIFKDRPDVDFLGKEICGEKGKYFQMNTTTKTATHIFEGKFK